MGNAKECRAVFVSVNIDLALACGCVRTYRSAWRKLANATALEDVACPVRACREYRSEDTPKEKGEIGFAVDPSA